MQAVGKREGGRGVWRVNGAMVGLQRAVNMFTTMRHYELWCVCVHVCVCMRVCVCMHVCMHVCARVCVRIHLGMCNMSASV